MNFDIANLVMNIGQANSKDWVDYFSALLTPVVAIFAGIIAYQQWQTQEKQRKQDLFEKRYENLYKKTIDIHYQMIDMDWTNIDDRSAFVKLTLEHTENLDKYGFLLKECDYNKLRKITKQWRQHIKDYSTKEIDIDKYKVNNSECIEKIKNVLTPYLRIESETQNLWQVSWTCLKKLFLFVIPINKINWRENDL